MWWGKRKKRGKRISESQRSGDFNKFDSLVQVERNRLSEVVEDRDNC